MSRGLGRIETYVMTIVAESTGGVTTQQIAEAIATHEGRATISKSLDASVRRACGALRRKRKLVSWRCGRHMAWAERVEAHDAWAESFAELFSAPRRIPEKDRARIVALLGRLNSDHDAERASAARLLERERQRLGIVWDEVVTGR